MPAGWFPPVFWGVWSITEPQGRAELLLTPRLSILLPCTVFKRKRKELIPLPPFLYSKQLESGTAHGSAALAPAAIEFPLLVTLASGSFTFCKVDSLLPCTD